MRQKSGALATLVLWLIALHCCFIGEAGLAGRLCEIPDVSSEAPCHGPDASSGSDDQAPASDRADCCDKIAMPLVTAEQTLLAPVATATLDSDWPGFFAHLPIPLATEWLTRDSWPPGAAWVTSHFIGSSLFGRAPPAVS